MASADSPNQLNAGNLTILNQLNQLNKLKPSTSLAQSTNSAQSTTSVRATCSYDESDNEAAPAEWMAAAAAAGATAGNKKAEPCCERVGQGTPQITWVDAAEDRDVPAWELIDEVDTIEEWNALDILDRAAGTYDVEG